MVPWRDVQHKVIGRTLGQLGLPLLDQRRSDNHQHQHQHDGDSKYDHLQGVGRTAPPQIRQTQTPDTAGGAAQRPATAQQQLGQQKAQTHGQQQARHDTTGQLKIPGIPPHETEDRDRTEGVIAPALHLVGVNIPTQHAHGWHPGESLQGRPGKKPQANQRCGTTD